MRKEYEAGIFVLVIVVGLTLGLTSQATAGGSNDSASEDPSTAVWLGNDFALHSQAFYVGAVKAFNNDITRSGFVVRLDAEYDHYTYNQEVDNLGRVRGNEYQGDAMLGYQLTYKTFSTGYYVGIDYQYHHLSPRDFTNSVRGAEVGAKIAADLETERELPYYVDLDGYFSTAFGQYWTRLRVGPKIPGMFIGSEGVFVGPELVFLGNQDFSAERVGGFANFMVDRIFPKPVEVRLSAGYQFVNGSNDGTSNGSTASTAGGRAPTEQ